MSGVDPLVRGISDRIRIVLNIAVVGFNSFTTRHNVSPAIQLLCGYVLQSIDITIAILHITLLYYLISKDGSCYFIQKLESILTFGYLCQMSNV